jgi:hypothetical protein
MMSDSTQDPEEVRTDLEGGEPVEVWRGYRPHKDPDPATDQPSTGHDPAAERSAMEDP